MRAEQDPSLFLPLSHFLPMYPKAEPQQKPDDLDPIEISILEHEACGEKGRRGDGELEDRMEDVASHPQCDCV